MQKEMIFTAISQKNKKHLQKPKKHHTIFDERRENMMKCRTQLYDNREIFSINFFNLVK